MQILLTSILAFISTNIDDIFILTLFFASRKFKTFTIVAGQYIGMASLVLISVIGSYIGNFVDHRYVGLLGLFPIYLAIKSFMALLKKGEEHEDENIEIKSAHLIAVAGVTIANGADNIGVYIPLLSTMSQSEKLVMVFVFGAMTYLWCLAGKYLATHPLIARQIDRFGHIIMPVVLLLLGVFILYQSESITLIKR